MVSVYLTYVHPNLLALILDHIDKEKSREHLIPKANIYKADNVYHKLIEDRDSFMMKMLLALHLGDEMVIPSSNSM